MTTLLKKLKEPSTFRGITILAGLVGFAIDPAHLEAIAAAVAATIGLIEVFRKEPQK
jgi:PII-like signaling protein